MSLGAARLSLAYRKRMELAPDISLTLHAKTLAVVVKQGYRVTSLHKGPFTGSKILNNISKFEMQRFPVVPLAQFSRKQNCTSKGAFLFPLLC